MAPTRQLTDVVTPARSHSGDAFILATTNRPVLAQLLAALRARGSVAEHLLAPVGLLGMAPGLARRAASQASAPAHAARLHALAQNLPLRALLREVSQAFSAAGVQAVLYKGQDYLHRVYGDPGARPMADADLLVRAHDLRRACAALIQAGFARDEACRTLHECKFVKRGMAIDLHHELLAAPRMRIPYAELFARTTASPVTPGLRAFEATDALLVHCVAQTVKGLCVPASSFVELQSLLEHCDPQQALERARAWRACSSLYAALSALSALGHTEARQITRQVPMPTLARARVHAVFGWLAAWTQLGPPPRVAQLAAKLGLVDRASDACAFMLRYGMFRLLGSRSLRSS